jgi:hypothetical protein
MQIKILLRLSCGLKLPNPKLGRRETALQLFMKPIQPTDAGYQVD